MPIVNNTGDPITDAIDELAIKFTQIDISPLCGSRLTWQDAARLAAIAQPNREVAEMREAVRAEIINSPETADFMAGVPLEAAHQRERWGSSHDAGKGPLDWFWLIGYLAQKAAYAQIAGDNDKALHHTVSTAGALANWHAAISGASTAMRPGIEPPDATLSPKEPEQS